MANLLFQIKDIWIVWPGGIGLELITIEKLLDKHDHPITKGAVFDLAVPRDQFSENGTFSVNSQFEVSSNNHAIYSVIDLGPNPIFSQFSGFVGIVYNILFFIGDFTLDEIFDGDANDLVVSEPSQKGGLSSPQSKLFENEYHLGQKSNPQIIDWVEDLLEKPLDAAEFADFFSPTPLALSSQLASTQNRKVGKLLQESQIAETATFVAIISPDSGITVSSGQIVTVIAEGSEGEPLSKVLFFTSDTSYLDEEAPFEFDLQIPDKALGNYLIAVLGKDMGGGNSYDEISVNVEASALLDSIVVQPETVLLQIADQELGLYVQGYYSDGIKRNLSGSEKEQYIFHKILL
ncbi:MAG: hypothetical protein O7D86_04215 [Proteobacteria bacterium]|nr:hypothetical protein [Pseudomonadota bacterium]